MDSCRKILVQHIKEIPVEKIAIATSGGVDSCSLVVAALDAGKDVSIFSFTFEDFESTDFITARRVADHFDLPFFPVLLPSNPEVICDGVRVMIGRYGVRSKVGVECMWPFSFLFDEMEKEGYTELITGLGTGGHFADSKSCVFKYPGIREDIRVFQKFRNDYFSNPNAAKNRDISRLSTASGVVLHNPYLSPDLFTLFSTRDFNEMNKPRQKEGIRKEFPELDVFKLKKNQNLQLGDSRISERIGAAVISKYAPHAKSPVYVYNRL